MAIATTNPHSGETVKTFDQHDDRAVDAAIEKAEAAYRKWRLVPAKERADHLARLADVLDRRQEELAKTAVLEMGKTIAAARAEVGKCALACRYYAENGPGFLEDRDIATNASRSFVAHQPIGPVLAVMPWNFPYWQVFRFAAPATVGGNVGLLKHASNVPQCALLIEETFREAGYPDGVFQTLLIGGGKVERVLRDKRVRAATLTGSEPAGASVASIAGSEIKKVVLELGGSDPFIVMPSADLDKAVSTAVTARLINNGQSCIAAKRFIVHQDVYEPFKDAFCDRMNQIAMGDPMSEETELGPLANASIRDDLVAQVKETVGGGAKLLVEGGPVDGDGYYYRPAVLADIPEGTPGRRDELFGPVAMLFRANDIDDAIRIANETDFGLGSAAFTNDKAEEARFVRDLDAGGVFINQMVASDPRIPFGGVKRSGFGRELSREGLYEFLNLKTVSVA